MIDAGLRRLRSNLPRDDEGDIFFDVELSVSSPPRELVLVTASSTISACSAWLSLLLPRVCVLRLEPDDRLELLSFGFRALEPDEILVVSKLSTVRPFDGCGRNDGEEKLPSLGLFLTLYKPSVPSDACVENGSARTCLRKDS